MTSFWRHPLAGLAASAALLTAVLMWMVIDRVLLLRSGTEIVLPVRPVDPRDLFKGDFVRLGFDIGQVPRELVVKVAGDKPREQTVFVTLEKDATDAWKPVAVATTLPRDLKSGQIAIRGTTSRWSVTFVRYGLERYYVPEGTGLDLEDKARKSQLSAIVAVDKKGKAAIKGLVVEGKRIYDEPLL